MNGPINLNMARKAKERAQAKQKADRNAVLHGRTKAERMLDATRNAQAATRLDGLKFEEDER